MEASVKRGECGGMVRERGEVRTKRGEARTKRGSREWADNEMGRRWKVRKGDGRY